MAKKTFVQLVDDFSGDAIEDGAGRTVQFAFDGAEYEIDLSNEHIEELRAALDPYVTAARRVGGRRSSGSRGSGSGRRSSGETAAIREWAASQGLQIATRGRIPAEIVERYRNR